MATPLSPARLLAALKAEGLDVREYRSWRTHNRNHKGPWGPVNGVLNHHTVTGPGVDVVALCYNGYSALPGPLCHGVIKKDGSVWLVSAGRSNHAGKGDADVLRAVIAEDYGDYPPTDNQANTDGNVCLYGFESENLGDGKDPWPRVQYVAMVKANVALLRAHGWGPKSAFAHKEWQPGKVDPRGIDMRTFRADVAACLKLPAGQWGAPPPAAPKEEEVSGETEQRIKSLHNNLIRIGSLTEKDSSGRGEIHGAGYYLAHIERDTTTLQRQVADLRAAVDKLTATGLTEAQIDALAAQLLDRMSGRLAE